MGLLNSLFGNNELNDKIQELETVNSEMEAKIADLENEKSKLESFLTPEMKDLESLKKQIAESQVEFAHQKITQEQLLKEQYDKYMDEISKQKSLILAYNDEINELNSNIKDLKKDIITFSDEILVQDFGLYEPRYSFINADAYKAELTNIRNKQKAMIKDGSAVSGSIDWQVNGSAAQGRKMIKDMQKLLLRAFNSECDEIINKVKYNNYDTSVKKMERSFNAIAKLGITMSISITSNYYDLKIQELQLALEYQIQKQREKEEKAELRAQQREEARLQKELKEQRKNIDKERKHYEQALSNINKQISSSSEENIEELNKKKEEIIQSLSDIDTKIKDIDYREANQKAGYVYIISNIGSFGEGIYKIGMTRRLNPQERVDELGDASVPFKFDVHAMIFSEDAPALEAKLHRAFEDRKLNLVNQRREFFKVSLDEIKEVVKNNFDKTVEFVEVPDADQYRISLKLREEQSEQ
jgi:chromosome segregation ATPase